jgi:hypothetical protein
MIVAIIFFGAIILGIISGIIAAVWGLISTKLWESFTLEEDCYANDDDEEDDLWDEAWARSAISKEENRKGFYFTYLLDTNNKWYKIWNFQWKQRVKIQILKWRTRRKLWK